METECNKIVRNSSIKIELDFSSQAGQAYVRFSNRTNIPLWFPDEQEPAYRSNYHTRTLTVWFGYCDEVYGEYMSRYMIPPMHLVPPGSDLNIEMASSALIEKLLEQSLQPQLQARIATKSLSENRIRGMQPLENYIEHSCIILSPAAATTTTYQKIFSIHSPAPIKQQA